MKITINSKEDFKKLSLSKKIIVSLALLTALGAIVLAVGIAVISVIPVVAIALTLGLVTVVIGVLIGVIYHHIKNNIRGIL